MASAAIGTTKKLLDTTGEMVSSAAETTKKLAVTAAAATMDGVSTAVDGVSTAAKATADGVTDIGQKLVTTFQGNLEDLLEGVEASLRGVLDKLQLVNNDDGSVTVNGYKLGKVLGTGAYGRVHLATKVGATYAVKVLKRSLVRNTAKLPAPPRRPNAPPRPAGGGGDSGLEAVLREVAVMKQLQHVNLVRLFAFIDDPQHNELYLVMECVDGGHLGKCIERREVVSEETITRWLVDTAAGLRHMHANGVAHRDLKPENLLWSARERRVKIADFGTAVNGGSTLCGATGRGSANGADVHVQNTAGTPTFFAPEMCTLSARSETAGYSARLADLWALGVSLYMWLYLETPYVAPTVHLLMEAIREGTARGVLTPRPAPTRGAGRGEDGARLPPLQPPVPVSPEVHSALTSLMSVEPTLRSLDPIETLRAKSMIMELRTSRAASPRGKRVTTKRQSKLHRALRRLCCAKANAVAPEYEPS